jgi:outer membrane protein assembly factor BamA
MLSELEANAILGEGEGISGPSQALQRCIAERVADALQERGYLKAKVRSVVLKKPRSIDEADATVAADPGALYRCGKFKLAGNLVFRPSELEPLVAIHRGDVFDVRKVRETMENLRVYYAGRGYGNVSFPPETSVDDEKKTVSVTLEVDVAMESTE